MSLLYEFLDQRDDLRNVFRRERILRRPGGPSRRELTALNLASMMTDWIGGIPTDDLEERYRVFYGGLVKTGEQFAWLLQALASVA